MAIRITDLSHSKQYSYQALHSLPLANVAETSKQLMQYGASNGQVLVWNTGSNNWVPTTLAGGGGGTVTTVSGTLPISVASGTTAPVVSISKADSSTSGYLSSADWNTFNNKQGALPAGGTSAHYYRGDNSWQTLNTSVVPENTNLYFTNARALGVPLTDFAPAVGAIVATDSALQAFGKAQGQINSLVTDSSKYLIKNNTDSITGLVNVGTTGLLQLVYTPVGLNDATNKAYVDSEVGTKVSKTGDTMSGVLTLDNDLKIKGGSNYVTVKGHATTNAYSLVLPQTAGTAGYVLATDGNGNTSWVTPTVGSSSITDDSIVDADINASAAIAQSKIAGLTTDLGNKEPTIAAGTVSQYWKGNKTWASLQTDVQALVLNNFSTGSNATVTNTDTVSGAFGKVQGQIDATNTVVAGKEASLTAGTASQYYRGDKSWQTLDGAVVANTAAGSIAATNVQNAINELDTEKQDKLISTSVVDSRELRFYELSGNGSNFTSLKSPDDLTADINYVLPAVAPSAGQVLSSSAAGVMSWINIPSAPVTTVHGRSGVVVSANGDYTASQITNVPAGTVAATTVQAALDEIASEKEPMLSNPSDTTKYYRGDKTWSTFATDAINSVLSTFALNAGSKPAVTNGDTVVGAFGKVQKTLNDINADYVSKTADQTINGNLKINSLTGFITVPDPVLGKDAANKDYVDGFGQWTKGVGANAGDIYRSSGNVGIGTSTPGQALTVAGMVESTVGGFKFPDGSTQTTANNNTQYGVQVKIGSFVSPASNGNYSVTGLGFKPTNVKIWVQNNRTGTMAGVSESHCTGSMTATAQMSYYTYANTTAVRNLTYTDRVIACSAADASTINIQASYVSMDADGFTINFSLASAGWTIIYEALGGSTAASSGSGSANNIAMWTNSTNLGTSPLNVSAGNVGVGTASPGQKLTVAGTIESTSGGVKFPDGTTQTSAAMAAYGMAYRTAAVSVSGSVYTTIALNGGNTSLNNVGHSTGTNPSRVTMNLAGTYRITYNAYVLNQAGSAGTMCGRFLQNGATVILGSTQCVSLNTGWGNVLDRQIIATFAANDYIEFQAWANLNLSFALTTTSTNETPLIVMVERIGP